MRTNKWQVLKLSKANEQYLKVKKKKSSKYLTPILKDMHLILQPIHLLYTKASSDMASVEEWLPNAIFKEGKLGENAEACPITQELD